MQTNCNALKICRQWKGIIMEGKKAVFFDADGTVCDIEKGTPDSAVESIRELVQNGHEAWLCTGRSRAFVPDYLEKIPFTGMICAAGATIEIGGKRVYNKEIPLGAAEASVEILRECGMVPVLEGADYMYYDKEEYTTAVDWYAELITRTLQERWKPIRGNEKVLHINKISAKKLPGCRAEEAVRRLSYWYDAISHEPGSLAGTTVELIPREHSKAVGIAAVLKLRKIPWENAIVFGDSNNDLSMFEYAAIKVAMGNGSPKIKALADYITADMFHYGIREGLRHFSLIK